MFKLYPGWQLYWWWKPEQTTRLPQVIDTLYRITLYRVHLDMSVIQTQNVSSDRHWLHHRNLLYHVHLLQITFIWRRNMIMFYRSLAYFRDRLFYWPSCPWSYGSWIYNYLCNQCLSPFMLRVRISIRVRCTTLCDKVCQSFIICLCKTYMDVLPK
jgi:hypothetical protein